MNPANTAEMIETILRKIGQDFDGECHLTEAEARQAASTIERQAEEIAALREATSGLLAFTGLLSVYQMADALIAVHHSEIGMTRDELANGIHKAQGAAWTALASPEQANG